MVIQGREVRWGEKNCIVLLTTSVKADDIRTLAGLGKISKSQVTKLAEVNTPGSVTHF